jgi:hypothetical protein
MSKCREDELNAVVIEVDDEAACRPAGRKYQVSASIFLPRSQGASERGEARTPVKAGGVFCGWL